MVASNEFLGLSFPIIQVFKNPSFLKLRFELGLEDGRRGLPSSVPLKLHRAQFILFRN